MNRMQIPAYETLMYDAIILFWFLIDGSPWRASVLRNVMPNYRRYRVPGGTYFFTVNLLERRQDTLVRYIDILREAVRKTRRERPFHIDAWVVLPDHMHCVWTLCRQGDDDFSNRWKLIKIRFVQAIPRIERRRSPVRIAKGERGIWQRRFWEHVIRDTCRFGRKSTHST